MEEYVVSYSGGMDSTSLLLHLLGRTAGVRIAAISFDYGQKHRIELECARQNAERLSALTGSEIVHRVVDIREAFSESASSLHTGGEAIPEGHYADASMKSTVVENRNVIFSAILYGQALSYSKRTGRKVTIALGIHGGDHTIYPDCRPESYALSAELFRISNWGSERVSYEAPFLHIDKAGVLEKGLEGLEKLGLRSHFEAIYGSTNTCYTPDEAGRGCGKCGACSERLEAFEKLGLRDPAGYGG
jgi:7-cyano-7-deazaguanine synthase